MKFFQQEAQNELQTIDRHIIFKLGGQGARGDTALDGASSGSEGAFEDQKVPSQQRPLSRAGGLGERKDKMNVWTRTRTHT